MIIIKVRNPQIESRKYVSFEIETLLGSSGQYITIRQRYSDFVKSFNLWKQLLEKRKRKKLPDLPNFSIFQRFNEKNIESRRKAMEEVLNKCSTIPYLLSSNYYQEFLGGCETHFRKDIMVGHIKQVRLGVSPETSLVKSLTNIDASKIRKLREEMKRDPESPSSMDNEKAFDPLVVSQMRSLKEREAELDLKEEEFREKQKEFESALLLFYKEKAKFETEKQNFYEEKKAAEESEEKMVEVEEVDEEKEKSEDEDEKE